MSLKLPGDCRELCERRVRIEEALGLKPVDVEKCVKVCRALRGDSNPTRS